jgi:hypothetical protein
MAEIIQKLGASKLKPVFIVSRVYSANVACIAKPLTDVTAKKVPERVPFGAQERKAFDALKELLYN